MNKTVNVTINNLIFHIEEEGYELLSEYLIAIKKHFKFFEDSEEIIEDIESRIAEQFHAKIKASKEVITTEDVEELILTMGTVEDFAQAEDAIPDDDDEIRTEPSMRKKRVRKLYRNPDDKIIAGVCSGLAAYFGLDATLVRIIFFISIFFGGTGLLLYLVLLVIVPEANSAAEKLEMQGEPLTISKIEEEIQRHLKKKYISAFVKNHGGQGKVVDSAKSFLEKVISGLSDIFRLIGQLFEMFFRKFFVIILFIIGLVIIIKVALVIAAITVGYVAMMINLQESYINFPITEYISGFNYYVLLTSLYLILLMPLFILMSLGISIMERKNTFSKRLSLAILIIWLGAISVFGIMSLKEAPKIEERKDEIMTYFQPKEKLVVVKRFSFLEVIADINITIKPGEKSKLVITGNAQDIENIDINQQGKKIIISQLQPRENCVFCINHDLEIIIYTDRIENLKISDNAFVVFKDFDLNYLVVNLKDRSRLNIIRGSIEKLHLEQFGYSRSYNSSHIIDLELVMSDDSYCNFGAVGVQKANVNLNGDSRADLKVWEDITGEVNNQARLYYDGTPIKESLKVTGDGDVIGE